MSTVENTFDRLFKFFDENPEKVRLAWEQVNKASGLGGITNDELLRESLAGHSCLPSLNSFKVGHIVFSVTTQYEIQFDGECIVSHSLDAGQGPPFLGEQIPSVASDPRHTCFVPILA